VNTCVDHNAEKLALEAHIPAAVGLLRWEGTLVGPVRVAGRRVFAVVSLIGPVHEHRVEIGWGPVVDRTEIAIHSEIAQLGALPPVAVQLVGVIAPVRHMSTARHSVFPFSMMCSAAVVMRRVTSRSVCVPTGGLLGRLGVVSVDERGSVDVLRDPLAPYRCPPQYEVYRRWVLEVMYERVLLTLGVSGG
jgi:hypothetical protein